MALQTLESIIHPLVAQERSQFLQKGIEKQQFLLVYDIPLLMKDPKKYEVDYSIVVSASLETQRGRVLQRNGMTIEKFQQILSKQIPDEIQREQADYVITTDFIGYEEAKSQLTNILNEIILRNQNKWNDWLSLPVNRHHSPETLIKGEERSERGDSEIAITEEQFVGNVNVKGQILFALTSSEIENRRLKEIFDTVIFDFDDTLAPAMGPLLDAHHAQMKYLSTILKEENFQYLKENLTREIRRFSPFCPPLTEEIVL